MATVKCLVKSIGAKPLASARAFQDYAMERQHELGSLLLGIELPPNAAIAEGGSTTREALIVASFAKAQIGLDDQGLPIELFLSNSEHGYISVTVVDDKVYVSYESMV